MKMVLAKIRLSPTFPPRSSRSLGFPAHSSQSWVAWRGSRESWGPKWSCSSSYPSPKCLFPSSACPQFPSFRPFSAFPTGNRDMRRDRNNRGRRTGTSAPSPYRGTGPWPKAKTQSQCSETTDQAFRGISKLKPRRWNVQINFSNHSITLWQFQSSIKSSFQLTNPGKVGFLKVWLQIFHFAHQFAPILRHFFPYSLQGKMKQQCRIVGKIAKKVN